MFLNFRKFFISFLNLSLLGIVVVGGLYDDVMLVKLLGIEVKCVLFLFREKYVVILFIDFVW